MRSFQCGGVIFAGFFFCCFFGGARSEGSRKRGRGSGPVAGVSEGPHSGEGGREERGEGTSESAGDRERSLSSC